MKKILIGYLVLHFSNGHFHGKNLIPEPSRKTAVGKILKIIESQRKRYQSYLDSFDETWQFSDQEWNSPDEWYKESVRKAKAGECVHLDDDSYIYLKAVYMPLKPASGTKHFLGYVGLTISGGIPEETNLRLHTSEDLMKEDLMRSIDEEYQDDRYANPNHPDHEKDNPDLEIYQECYEEMRQSANNLGRIDLDEDKTRHVFPVYM